jgi:hypothetical protein
VIPFFCHYDIERYSYDKAGNMLKKTVNGKTTMFTFDGANQLVSSTVWALGGGSVYGEHLMLITIHG